MVLTPFTSSGVSDFIDDIKQAASAFGKYNAEQDNATLGSDDFYNTIAEANVPLQTYLKSLNGAEASMKGYIGYLVGAKIETLALQAGTVLLNAGLSFMATLIINKIVGAYQDYKQGLKDAADSAKQAATDFESAKTQMEEFAQSYHDLGDSAEWDTTSTEKAKSLQEQILELFKGQSSEMDDLLDKIDLANGKYEEQKQILNDIALQNAKDKQSDLGQNLINAQRDAQKTIGFLSNKGDYTDLRGNSAKEAHYLASQGIGSSYGNGNRADFYLGDFDFSNIDDVVAAYDKVNSAIDTLVANYDKEELAESELYSSLTSLKGQLEDNVNAYKNALDAYQDNEAVVAVGDALKTANIDSKESFDDFVESVIESEDANDDYADKIREVAESAYPEYADAADEAADANSNFGDSAKDVNIDELWQNVNSQIDSIQSAYNSLTSAIDEYNQYGALSMDTLQSLLTLDDQYLACLIDQNGQLSLNMQSFQNVANARLNDAKTTAVQQAMEELNTIAQNNEISTAGGAASALANKGAVIDTLAAQYKNLGDWAGYAAKAEALADAYGKAAAVDADAADAVMSGLNAKFALIDSTMSQIQSSAAGAGKALGGYGNAAKGAGGSSGGAAKQVDELTDSLNKQKEAIEETKKALEEQQNQLKIYGQAAVDELEKRIDALNDEKDAQDDAFDKEKERIKNEQELKDAAFDKEKKRLKAEKDLQDKLYKKQKEELQNQKKLQDDIYQKQIDALKEKKEALQDANDEEDRAIELAKLQAQVEQAKSQRTNRVYEHDTGFEWKVDESAVSDAQNALDDKQREWRRADAISAIEDEIDAVEKLKDTYDDQIDSEIDGIDKAKDAYDEKIENMLDKLNQEKEAFDEMMESQIAEIEARKDAYDEAMNAEIEKLEVLKDEWNDTLSLVGTSWDEYQAKLAAAAEFQGMSLEQMAASHTTYKDNVIANMQAIGEADAQLASIEEQLTAAEEAKNAATSSGAGSTGGAAGATNNYATAADALTAKLGDLAIQIATTGDQNDALKEREAELLDQLSSGTLGTIERKMALEELDSVQAQIAANEQTLSDLSAQYVEAIANETNVTVGYRQQQMDVLSELADNYDINYGMIADTLNEYLSNLDTTTTTNEQKFDAIKQTISLFAQNAKTDMANAGTSMTTFQSTMTGALQTCGGSVDTLIGKLGNLAQAAANAIKAVANAKQAAANASSGTEGHALGSQYIRRTGLAKVDEEGPEIVVRHGGSNGRYTYLERGDSVIPASYSKNLWDLGANPAEWFERQYNKFNRMDTSKAVYTGGDVSYSISVGDIVISNPIANSDDLARGLKQNLPASFMQAIGVRM